MHAPTARAAFCRLGTRPRNPAGTLRQCAVSYSTGIATNPGPQEQQKCGLLAGVAKTPIMPPGRICIGSCTHSPSPHHVGARNFHSHDHPPPPGPFGATEAVLLAAAYKHVPEHGFTTAALAFGARDAGFPDVSTSVIPDGEFGLIRWHLAQQKERLAARASELFRQSPTEAAPGAAYTIPEKLEMLMWERLMGNKEVIGQWQQALAVMANPTHVPESVKMLAELADEIVFLSGDKAVDPSWYSTRGGVSAIYASTELFMTSDTSEGFADTRQFLRRRMKEAKGMKRALGDVGQWIGYNAMGALNVARSWGMKI